MQLIHLYNSTSVAQREQVFKKDKEQIKKIAVDGAELLRSWQMRQMVTLHLNTARRVSLEQRLIMQSRCVMQS